MKSTETLMHISQLSKWAFTSFVPSTFATLVFKVMPLLSAVHFILSDRFQRFYLQNAAAYWSFLIESNEN
jgi:hypothetical protein